MYKILVFGDSIIFGKGDDGNNGWVGRLKKELESENDSNAVFNLGISGNSTKDLLKRIEVECEARIKNKPEHKYVIIIGVGANDSKKTEGVDVTTFDEFTENIKKICETARKFTKNVIFMGLMPFDERFTHPYKTSVFTIEKVKKYNDFIMGYCKDNKIFFIDMFEHFIKTDYKKLFYDGIHPNTEGYDLMYERIKKILIPYLNKD
ncbi:GDSL-like Lipase/Acylhydrolase family protein [Candidatus Tiddalikarchaeum anstoanum]|nr:GDSL-like Lipase/Acylhydrolase family protein [Candidatus Tiddalikarchaeum anstoanum]